MPKLTIDLIERATSFLSATNDWELDLRDNRIPAVENLGVTNDQHDCIDLTNNDIRTLDNFPKMHKLKTLLCANNRIQRVDLAFSQFLPNLESLVLANNQIDELAQLEGVFGCVNLKRLVLLDNTVTTQAHYRELLIHRLPSLKTLDYTKVSMNERELASKMFQGVEGDHLLTVLSAAGTKFTPSTFAGSLGSKKTVKENAGLTPAEISSIKTAIKNAKTLEEVTRLDRILRTGKIPTSA